MPLEKIATVSTGTETGYVIDDGGPTTLILKEDDRTVVRVPSDEVRTRVVCVQSGDDERSLLARWAWRDGPHYPICT
jgi:hypothetical protein